jgi:hypothetical protein
MDEFEWCTYGASEVVCVLCYVDGYCGGFAFMKSVHMMIMYYSYSRVYLRRVVVGFV